MPYHIENTGMFRGSHWLLWYAVGFIVLQKYIDREVVFAKLVSGLQHCYYWRRARNHAW